MTTVSLGGSADPGSDDPQWCVDAAELNLVLLGVAEADDVQRPLLHAVAASALSADAAVRQTAARFGARIAPKSPWRPRDFDDYLIAGTFTLKSRLIDDDNPHGIVDPVRFRELEIEISRIRLVELAASPVSGHLDYAHLREIHRRVFRDIFEWAGQQRVGPDTPMIRYAPDTVNFGPGDPDAEPVKYTYYPGPDIAEAASVQFAQLEWLAKNTDLPRLERLDRISESGGEIQSIHPFRDGNSRAMTAFSIQYQNSIGFTIDPGEFLANTALREQLVHAWYHYQATGVHENITHTLDQVIKPETDVVPPAERPATP